MKPRGILLVTVAVAALAAGSSSVPASAAGYAAGTDYFSFRDPEITESSGVVASSRRDGVYFTHNDSGDSARFFAVDDRGCTLARYSYAAPPGGVADVEDIARGPHAGASTLWLADIGDNLHQRTGIAVYAVTEPQSNASAHRESDVCPTPATESLPATAYRLAYPDVAHDAETLLADPVSGQLFVVTKAPTLESQVYAAPLPLDPDAVNVLTLVTEIVFPPSPTYDRTPEQIVARGLTPQVGIDAVGRLWAVGGDIAPGRDRLVIRTQTDAWEWAIDPGESLRDAFLSVPTPRPLVYERQGEAIAYSRDGTFLVTTCEDAGCTAHRYDPA